MNCDQAFDLMTDPSADDSAVLHQHMGACPRCRQMYETLSPALGLFERPDTPPAPACGDADSASSVEIAERFAVRLAKTSPAPHSKQYRRRTLAAGLAMGLIGFVTAFGLAAMWNEPSTSSPLLSEECTWLNRDAADDTQPQRSDAVVLSCVACHLTNPAETSDTSRVDVRLTVLARLIN